MGGLKGPLVLRPRGKGRFSRWVSSSLLLASLVLDREQLRRYWRRAKVVENTEAAEVLVSDPRARDTIATVSTLGNFR